MGRIMEKQGKVCWDYMTEHYMALEGSHQKKTLTEKMLAKGQNGRKM